MGKAIISHLSLFTGGVLSLAEGTYPGWGVHTLAREVPYLAGVLTFVWSTHLARGLPTFARGYLPWLGRYLPWLGDTYPGFEVPTLTRKGYLPWLGSNVKFSKNVNLSKRCQVVIKMSSCQKMSS